MCEVCRSSGNSSYMLLHQDSDFTQRAERHARRVKGVEERRSDAGSPQLYPGSRGQVAAAGKDCPSPTICGSGRDNPMMDRCVNETVIGNLSPQIPRLCANWENWEPSLLLESGEAQKTILFPKHVSGKTPCSMRESSPQYLGIKYYSNQTCKRASLFYRRFAPMRWGNN